MDKQREKGFTLIELLVTIALMLSILGIAVMSFINLSDRKKDETWKTVKLQIEAAAIEYFTANEYLFEGLSDGFSGSITVGKLVEEDYLNKVANPKTGVDLNECSEIKVEKEGSKYIATYTGNLVSKVDNKCENKYLVQLKDAGGPSGEIYYYKNDGTRINNDGWFNIDKLGDGGNLKVCIKPETNNNGAIASAKIGNFTVFKENNGYYCTVIEADMNRKVTMELKNVSGKKWSAEPTIQKDTKKPSCSHKVAQGTIGNKVDNIQWYKEGKQPKITYEGKDENGSGVAGIYQYTNDILNKKTSNATFTENITSQSRYYNAVVKDNAGNSERCGGYYGYDNNPPSCNIKIVSTNKMTNGWFKATAYFKTTSISNDVATWTWKTDQWDNAPTYNFNEKKHNDITDFYISAAGNRKVTINMTDIAGNTGTCSKDVTLYNECSEVSYREEACTKTCGGGTKNLLAYDKYTGARCSSKDTKRECNTHACQTQDVCSNVQKYVSISSRTTRTRDGYTTRADGENYTYVDFNFNINNNKIKKIETHAAFCKDEKTCLNVNSSNKNQTRVKCFSKQNCFTGWEYVGASMKVKCGSTTKTFYYSHKIGTQNTWTNWK